MKNKILSLAFACIVCANVGIAGNGDPKSASSENSIVCPLIQLSSPPSTLAVGVHHGACPESLTVNSANCTPFTFHFTWSGGSYTASTGSGSAVLSFDAADLNTTAGTTINLYITDCCGGSSGNYSFTGVSTCP